MNTLPPIIHTLHTNYRPLMKSLTLPCPARGLFHWALTGGEAGVASGTESADGRLRSIDQQEPLETRRRPDDAATQLKHAPAERQTPARDTTIYLTIYRGMHN